LRHLRQPLSPATDTTALHYYYVNLYNPEERLSASVRRWLTELTAATAAPTQ
jgi:hypothetical protein